MVLDANAVEIIDVRDPILESFRRIVITVEPFTHRKIALEI